jgi:hypothetical protein
LNTGVGIIGVGQAGMASADDLLHDLGDVAENPYFVKDSNMELVK